MLQRSLRLFPSLKFNGRSNVLLKSVRNYSVETETGETSAPKFKKNRNNKSSKPKKEMSYEDESKEYILKELLKSKKQFDQDNTKLSEISVQFKDLLQLHGLTLVKAPLREPISFREDAIHISKSVGDMQIDLLVDYKTSEDTQAREAQIILTNTKHADQVLYFMGLFTKDEGLLLESCMPIDTTSISKSSEDVRSAICDGEQWIFKHFDNKFQKPLDVSNPIVREFLLSTSEFDFETADLDGRSLVDALVNYWILDALALRANDPDSARPRLILWMLGTYCENNLQGLWLDNLIAFIQK